MTYHFIVAELTETDVSLIIAELTETDVSLYHGRCDRLTYNFT